FGASRDGNYVGNLGDVSFFSLYKQFPSFRGGMLVCPEDWKIDLPKTSFNLRDIISFLNCFLFFALIFKKLGRDLAPRIIKKEKNLEPSGINRISLGLFSNFLKDFDKSSKKRKNLALFFKQELEKLNFSVQESENNVFCYFSALVPEEFKNKRDKIVLELRKKNIFCNRIWHTPIILNNEARREYQINLENFPNSVEVAGRIINFPMQDYYKEEDIKNMINNIREVIAKI
ncbi:MAG: DegT/DnrJ/EryC1/StrS family aminotransferase, partial [Candidatus Parcubacteria bacterium]|nr:DegT/DnrJ/EryC1/StrS family aminotransferase [Candidatus Parcubacteria bacterium]